MTITKVIKDLIEPNTYNQLISNIGNTQPVTINSLVYANVTFSNTSNTSVPTTGGYLKIFGTNFQANSNVFFNNTLSSNVSFVSNSELRIVTPSLTTGTYSLFLYNPDGSNAVKYKSLTVQGDFNYGYALGGAGTSGLSSVERVDFANDTSNTDGRGNLNTVYTTGSSTRNNLHGYVLGGTANNTTTFSSIKRITFNNDTTTAITRSDISVLSNYFGGTVENSSYAWTGGTGSNAGGTAGTGTSSVSRYDFLNDTNAATLRTNLTIARTNLASVSNLNNFGWFAGGSNMMPYFQFTSPPQSYTVTTYSTIDRIDYNSDTNTALVRGSLNTARAAMSATRNSNYGWFCSGFTTFSFASSPTYSYAPGTSSTIQRMSFSNDVATTLSRANGDVISHYSSFGNEDFGWFAGGILNSGPNPSTSNIIYGSFFDSISRTNITRLTYVTDTTAVATRSNFSVFRRGHSGISGLVT